MLAKEMVDKEYLYGHKACQGCSLGIVGRFVTKVMGPKTVIAVPPSCMSTVTTQFPSINYMVPSVTSPFPAAGALVAGISAGLKSKNIDDVRVVALAGDGGTADIGLQALSGAIDQGYDFIYVCYDNEAYMNTGTQRSSATPIGATTSTTPSGSCSYGEMRPKKNLFEIMIAHRIPYAAMSCTSYPNDLVKKLEKCRDIKGPTFLQILAPCPTGWGFHSSKTIEIGRQAVKCGLWYLAEYEKGKVTVNMVAKEPESVREYFKAQSRFRHIDDEQIKYIESLRDKELEVVKSWC